MPAVDAFVAAIKRVQRELMSDHEEEPPASRRGAIVAFVVIAVAIVAVIFIVRQLHQASVIQDCVMSGRTNCVQIQAPAR
jgi:hypothetical protein